MKEDRASRHAIWHNRDFLLFWSGGSLSLVGSTMSRIAFPLLALEITRSAASAGLVGALTALPYPVLGLPAGALADRWDRRRMMIVCDLGRAAALGSVPLALWTGHAGLLQLCVVATIEASLFTFYHAAWNAAVPRVVSVESVPGSLALHYGSVNIASIAGPPLGGVLWLLRGPFALVQSTKRRQILPDKYQGRVNTFFELLKQGTDAIALALAGVLLSTMGAHPLIILLFASLGLPAVFLSVKLKPDLH